MNSLYTQLNQQQNVPGLSSNTRQLINTLKSARNPKMMLQNMMQSNPQVKQVMQYVQQAGGDPKTAFYKLAEQKGINPNEILQMLK